MIENCGAPGEIRTPDTQVRSLVLYPFELRAQAQKEAPVTGEGGKILIYAFMESKQKHTSC